MIVPRICDSGVTAYRMRRHSRFARGRFTRKYFSANSSSRLRKGPPQLRQASRRSADFGSASTRTTLYRAPQCGHLKWESSGFANMRDSTSVPSEAANTIKRPKFQGFYATALDRRKAAQSADLGAPSLMGLWSNAPTVDVGRCARRSLHRTRTYWALLSRELIRREIVSKRDHPEIQK
jgi:hypothetical protein